MSDSDKRILELEAQVDALKDLVAKVVRERDSVMAVDAMRLLTYKQQAVMAMVLAGHTYRQTAELAGLSESTIKLMMRGVHQKFGVRGGKEFDGVFAAKVRELIAEGVQERLAGVAKDFGANPRKYPDVLKTLGHRKHV